jgi:hypothetical protein
MIEPDRPQVLINVSALSEARFQEELRTSTELRARVR